MWYRVGHSGFCWTSSISVHNTSAHYLNFGYGGINPQSNNYHAYGFPLRCLLEHPKGVLLAIRRRKFQPSRAERHRDRRSRAPEPPPATGATSTDSVLPALAPGRHLVQPQNILQYRAPDGARLE